LPRYGSGTPRNSASTLSGLRTFVHAYSDTHYRRQLQGIPGTAYASNIVGLPEGTSRDKIISLGMGPVVSFMLIIILQTLVNKNLRLQLFGRPFVKRFALRGPLSILSVCPVLSCPICLSVCNFGVLWRNGWVDQGEI